MVYPNGKVETKLKGMANVFRHFHEELYALNGTPKNTDNTTFKSKQQVVTIKEVDKALKELKKWKMQRHKVCDSRIHKVCRHPD